ncbi:MAG: recombination mediator RecR [Parachlamydiales bacterium]|jgi:recombination protein RecR
MSYPKHLNKMIAVLNRLPGVGRRTAERFAFHMLTWSNQKQKEFAQVIDSMDQHIRQCDLCGCLCDVEACPYCSAERNASKLICVIAEPKDAFSIEETGTFRGMYHVLGGLLNPIEGIDSTQLRINMLCDRIQSQGIEEIILALDATLEGDTTALYLKDRLAPQGVKLSRLAFGLPMGSAFDFIDGSTLARALAGRNHF